MTSVPQIAEHMERILNDQANELAKQTGYIQRVRKFTGASLLQTLIFGGPQHPDASLEQLASTAELGEISVTDTAVDKRFTPQCAAFLHAVLEQMSSVVVQAAHDVPIRVLRCFSAVILEDSSSVSLPNELAELWRQSGPHCGCRQAACALGTQTGTALGTHTHRWADLRSHESV